MLPEYVKNELKFFLLDLVEHKQALLHDDDSTSNDDYGACKSEEVSDWRTMSVSVVRQLFHLVYSG